MIKIVVNDKEAMVEDAAVLYDVLGTLDIKPPYAVMLNNQHIVRSAYQNTHLKAGDSIQLITPMQGG